MCAIGPRGFRHHPCSRPMTGPNSSRSRQSRPPPPAHRFPRVEEHQYAQAALTPGTTTPSQQCGSANVWSTSGSGRAAEDVSLPGGESSDRAAERVLSARLSVDGGHDRQQCTVRGCSRLPSSSAIQPVERCRPRRATSWNCKDAEHLTVTSACHPEDTRVTRPRHLNHLTAV